MPVTDNGQRIRKRLSFLSLANRRVVKAAVQIAKLAGTDDPPDAGDLLSWFRFEVEGIRYGGRMTQRQYNYLERHQGSLHGFANAIADIILNLNYIVVQTLRCLDRGLAVIQDEAAAARAQEESPLTYYLLPPLGC